MVYRVIEESKSYTSIIGWRLECRFSACHAPAVRRQRQGSVAVDKEVTRVEVGAGELGEHRPAQVCDRVDGKPSLANNRSQSTELPFSNQY